MDIDFARSAIGASHAVVIVEATTPSAVPNAPGKRAIIEALDESRLLLPSLLHQALAANARIKYVLTLLQLARAHADAPEGPVPDLRTERQICGIDEPALDDVPATSRLRLRGIYFVPGAAALVRRMGADVEEMLAALRAAGGEVGSEAAAFADRLRNLDLKHASTGADGIRGESIDAMASADPGCDSLHRLVMDVHRALNALETRVATEVVDGAQVYAIEAADRPLVAAFMRGIAQTRHLKFGHPGLGTTATRDGPMLVLENDVGTTEAHILVVHVQALRVTVITTDVHLQRVQFFRSLFERFPVRWRDTHAQKATQLGDELFYLCTGVFEAQDAEDLSRFLTFLGSRLVFLIDWNRARKQLREFVGRGAAADLLRRAAEEGYGHRGFLELGGARMMFDAMTAVLRAPFRFGERLDEMLGATAAGDLLAFALRRSAQGLLEGASHALLREEVRVELAACVAHTGERLFEPVQRHAAVVVELARALQGALDAPGAAAAEERVGLASRAKQRERAADEVVVQMRGLAGRLPDAARYARVIDEADDAADALEDAVFNLTLLPADATLSPDALDELRQLADLLAAAAEAWSRCVACARTARAGMPVAGMLDFLAAADRILAIERQTDDGQRRVTTALLRTPAADARLLFTVTQVAAGLENAADALMHAALATKDVVLGSAMASESSP